jgi:hypothetical protein
MFFGFLVSALGELLRVRIPRNLEKHEGHFFLSFREGRGVKGIFPSPLCVASEWFVWFSIPPLPILRSLNMQMGKILLESIPLDIFPL